MCGLVVALPALAAAADGRGPTPSIFAPVSTPAFAIRELAFFVLGITASIFVVVAGFGVYASIRFRRRPGDDGREPPQVYGSTQIELAWTVVPAPDRRRAVPRDRALHLRASSGGRSRRTRSR